MSKQSYGSVKPISIKTLQQFFDFCKNYWNLPHKYREASAGHFITSIAPVLVDQLNTQKDQAYKERNMLVAYLSKVFPSYRSKHPEDKDWDADWMNIIFIKTPEGQISFHVHDSEMPLFVRLEQRENDWDGHTTEEKYRRLIGDLLPQAASPKEPAEESKE